MLHRARLGSGACTAASSSGPDVRPVPEWPPPPRHASPGASRTCGGAEQPEVDERAAGITAIHQTHRACLCAALRLHANPSFIRSSLLTPQNHQSMVTSVSCRRRRLPRLGLDACHGGDHIAEATSATRVPDLACAATRGDVFTNPVDRAGRSARRELGADRGLGLAEAVADLAIAERAFLPDRHSHIGRGEPRALVVEVHDIASSIRA